jgi:hypothetical protein
VGLRQKVPVYIVYFTSFVRDGTVRFRSDLYGTDRRAIARLEEGLGPSNDRNLKQEIRRLAGEGRKKK